MLRLGRVNLAAAGAAAADGDGTDVVGREAAGGGDKAKSVELSNIASIPPPPPPPPPAPGIEPSAKAHPAHPAPAALAADAALADVALLLGVLHTTLGEHSSSIRDMDEDAGKALLPPAPLLLLQYCRSGSSDLPDLARVRPGAGSAAPLHDSDRVRERDEASEEREESARSESGKPDGVAVEDSAPLTHCSSPSQDLDRWW